MNAWHGQLNWWQGGIALAMVFLLAVWLVKPVGVSTQFVIADGLLASLVNPELVVADKTNSSGYSSEQPYLNKSGGKYAAAIANPWNYGFIFVLAMVPGAWLSARLSGPGADQAARVAPPVWRQNWGDKAWSRYLAAFLGGILVLYGARLAGGCTSGHMMSGMMQLAISGFVFTVAAFAAGVPLAITMYRK